MTKKNKSVKKQDINSQPLGVDELRRLLERSPREVISPDVRQRLDAMRHQQELDAIAGGLSKDEKQGLVNKFSAVMAEATDLPEEDRQALAHDFAQKTTDTVSQQYAEQVQMPDMPPEMWKAGQGETALEFLDRVYGPQVEARLLTYTWLAEHNPALGTSVRTAGRRANLDVNALPVTQTEANQQSYDRLVARIGEDVFDEVVRVASVMQKRASRSKNDGEEPGVF